MLGLGLSLGLAPIQGVRYDYYVDSVNGNDANAGTSAGAAYQSFGPVLAQANLGGKRIGLARGSVFREEVLITAANVTVGDYGFGALPLIDAGEAIANAGFTATSGQAGVYQVAVTFTGTTAGVPGGEYRNAYENDRALKKMSSLAACQSTAGSCYWSAEGAGVTSATLYIHPYAGDDPTSNGKAYAYTKRYNGLAITGASATVRNIRTRRQRRNDGSMVLSGRNSVMRGCTIEDGHKHAALMGAGGLIDGCTFRNGYWGKGGSNPNVGCNHVVFFDGGSALPGFSWVGSIFEVDDTKTNEAVVGVISHTANGTDPFGSVLSRGNKYTGASVASMSGSDLANAPAQTHSNNLYVNCITTDRMSVVGGTMDWQGQAVITTTLTGTVNLLPNPAVAATVNVHDSKFSSNTYTALAASGAGSTVTIDRTLIYQQDTSGKYPNYVVTAGAANVTISINNCTVQKTQQYDVFEWFRADTIYTGDNNHWVSPYPRFSKDNGATYYSTLATWQAASGQDTHSDQTGDATSAADYSGWTAS